VAAGAAALYSFTAPKRYEARAELLVSPLPAKDSTFAGFAFPHVAGDPGSAVETVARLVRTPEIAEAVQGQLGLSGSRTEVLDSVSTHRVDDTNLVAVVGKASRAARAAQIANAFADELVAQRTSRFQTALTGAIRRVRARLRSDAGRVGERRALARRLSVLVGLVATRDPTLEVASDAVAPKTAAWPRPWLVIPLGALAALVAATVGAALVRLPTGRERPAPPAAPPLAPPQRPPAPAPRPPPPPAPPPPEPEIPVAGEGGAWNLNTLRRLVEERGRDYPDRLESWTSYLFFLRQHVGADGRLPSSFDALVEEEFRELLPP
jgi:uncharacterized protein involved in exopolysaccharide biosynthesis